MTKSYYKNDEELIEALGRIAIFLNDKNAIGYQIIVNQAQELLKQLTDRSVITVPVAKQTENSCNEAIFDYCIDAFRNGKSIYINGKWITDYGVAVGSIARAVQCFLEHTDIRKATRKGA